MITELKGWGIKHLAKWNYQTGCSRYPELCRSQPDSSGVFLNIIHHRLFMVPVIMQFPDNNILASCSNMGYYYGPEFLAKELKQNKVLPQPCVLRVWTWSGSSRRWAENNSWALQDVFDKSIHFMQSVMCGECIPHFEVTNQQNNIVGGQNAMDDVQWNLWRNSRTEKQKILTPNLLWWLYHIHTL